MGWNEKGRRSKHYQIVVSSSEPAVCMPACLRLLFRYVVGQLYDVLLSNLTLSSKTCFLKQKQRDSSIETNSVIRTRCCRSVKQATPNLHIFVSLHCVSFMPIIVVSEHRVQDFYANQDWRIKYSNMAKKSNKSVLTDLHLLQRSSSFRHWVNSFLTPKKLLDISQSRLTFSCRFCTLFSTAM